MPQIPLTRSASLPDDLRVARCLSAPHMGPRVLFFSGGTALTQIARQLKRFTYNSVHLVTPFDSGGSSNALRRAFGMPAVGDLRSRLVALADESVLGQPEALRLIAHRLPQDASPEAMRADVQAMAAGTHALTQTIPGPLRCMILDNLNAFCAQAPADFDFRRASIGNLVLAGGWLTHDQRLEPVLFQLSKMVDLRGTVRPIVDEPLHIGAELADGRQIHGQARLTGKEGAPLAQPIRRLFLSDGAQALPASAARLPERNARLIRKADLICYPPGSLFTSVIANLLPHGVGRTIAARHVPKVYLPSLGPDPECPGMTLKSQVQALLDALRADAGRDTPTDRLVTHVICDSATPQDEVQAIEARFGIPCARLDLRGEQGAQYHPARCCETLISLI